MTLPNCGSPSDQSHHMPDDLPPKRAQDMSKRYLHIGLPKTGTTAIQAYRDLGAKQLREDEIIYIDTRLSCNFALSLLAMHAVRPDSIAQQFFINRIFPWLHRSYTFLSLMFCHALAKIPLQGE